MSLDPHALTWTSLLGKWMAYAQASLALPKDATGDRWRASVNAVIELQAVTLALGELAEIAEEDRPLARDRAEVLIGRSSGVLHETWRGEPMPESLLETAHDALVALDMSTYAGLIELIWHGPGVIVMPARTLPLEGTLAAMQAGTLVMPGEPVAWWTECDPVDLVMALGSCERRTPSAPRQVYRELDEHGRITRDVIAPILGDPLPGVPLLVPLCRQGEPIGHFTVDPEEWEQQQRAAMTGEMIEVDDRTAGNGDAV